MDFDFDLDAFKNEIEANSKSHQLTVTPTPIRRKSTYGNPAIQEFPVFPNDSSQEHHPCELSEIGESNSTDSSVYDPKRISTAGYSQRIAENWAPTDLEDITELDNVSFSPGVIPNIDLIHTSNESNTGSAAPFTNFEEGHEEPIAECFTDEELDDTTDSDAVAIVPIEIAMGRKNSTPIDLLRDYRPVKIFEEVEYVSDLEIVHDTDIDDLFDDVDTDTDSSTTSSLATLPHLDLRISHEDFAISSLLKSLNSSRSNSRAEIYNNQSHSNMISDCSVQNSFYLTRSDLNSEQEFCIDQTPALTTVLDSGTEEVDNISELEHLEHQSSSWVRVSNSDQRGRLFFYILCVVAVLVAVIIIIFVI
ncbi:hypothetical protein PCE1_004977 [Barthelona sp. PCE]